MGAHVIVEVRRQNHVQRLTLEDFEQRVRDGEIDPATPVRFEVVTGDEFRPAGDLELYQELALPHRRAFRRALTLPSVPLATALLVGVQVRIYLWSWAPGVDPWLQDRFTNWAPAVLELGEWWRPFTYGLLHVGLTHLLFNMCFLAYTGYHLERALGRANLLALYFASVFAGGLLSMAMAQDRPSLGASGGDFGLLAAAVVLGWKHWDDIPARARKYYGWALAPYPAIAILSGLQAENVDNWCHLGGLVAGALLATALDPEELPDRAGRNRLVRRATIGGMALLAALVAWQGPLLVPLDRLAASGWTVARPSTWKEGWTLTGDRGWYSLTQQGSLAATTTVHARPIGPDAAADAFVDRVAAGAGALEVVSREPVVVGGLEGRRIVLGYEHSGERQSMTALVLTRGVHEHRLSFRTPEGAASRYRPLLARIERSVRIEELDELVEARERAAVHPRSWEPAALLGRALYRSGAPEQARLAYQRAIDISPRHTSAWEGLLRVHADYGLAGGAEAAKEALAAMPNEPEVIAAAADAFDAAGEKEAADAALGAAWEALPGDRVIRRARLQRGLPVEPFTAPPGEIAPDPAPRR